MKINPALRKLFEQGLLWSSSERLPYAAPQGKILQALPPAMFSVPEIDVMLPGQGLACGSIHEFALEDELSSKVPYRWHPPLFVVAALLGSTIRLQQESMILQPQHKILAWVGRRCWPTPHLLESISTNSIYLDPPDKSKRLWTIIQLLRCPAVWAVVADGSGFNNLASRRLSFAAQKGGALGLILRPPWELEETSSAHTKWKIAPLCSEKASLRWSLTLLRAKGAAAASVSPPQAAHETLIWPKTWLLEWDKEKNNGKGALCIIDQPHKKHHEQRERRAAA